MMNLLDIQVEILTPEQVTNFDRIAMVDVQPHAFRGVIDRVDLVIDHHSRAAGLHRCVQRHSRRLRIRPRPS
jgi:hypothetical protein